MRPSSCCHRPRRPGRAVRRRSLETASACWSERGWAIADPLPGCEECHRHCSQGRRSQYMVKRLRTTPAVAGAVMLLVSACGGSSATPTPAASVAASASTAPSASASAEASASASASAAPSASAAANLPATPTGYAELDKALGSDKPYNGKKVSIQTQWTGGEATGFANAIADFTTATGIAVQVDSIGSSHETVLRTRVEGGQPPDMSQIAQPTAVLAYAKENKLIDVGSFMDKTKLNAEFPTTIGLTTDGDHIWSIPTKA